MNSLQAHCQNYQVISIIRDEWSDKSHAVQAKESGPLRAASLSTCRTGALAVIRYAKIHGTKHRPWLTGLLARRPAKVAAIALANKIARMAWAMMARSHRAAGDGSSRRKRQPPRQISPANQVSSHRENQFFAGGVQRGLAGSSAIISPDALAQSRS